MKTLVRLNQPLFFLLLLIALLILLKAFLIPLAYGFIVALMVYPLFKKLREKKINTSLAIFISLLVVFIIAAFVVFIFSLQFKIINREIPELMNHLDAAVVQLKQWIASNTGISISEQNNLISDTEKNLMSNFGQIIKRSFSFAAEAVINLIVIPLYAALILFYRRKLVEFAQSLLKDKLNGNFSKIISETIHIFFNYVKGMLWVYLIVGVLNSIGLLLLGVDYAILFGMVTAIMTIIPYLGILLSSVLPITMVWNETNNVLYPIGVVAVFAVVQYLEANIIFPYIVGKQLGVNTLVSIISIFLGAVIWGMSGMILFLLFVALAKIIINHIDEFKPLSKLLDVS